MQNKLLSLMIRPIVFFDIETTGLDINSDRIVEISITKLFADGKKEIKTRRINPGIPVSPEAFNVHGISYNDVINEPTFNGLAKSLYSFIKNCDIATFNGNKFDIPILAREFYRCGIEFRISDINVIDVRNIYTAQFPRDLVSAYKDYTGKDLAGAHAAENDVMATFEILEKQVEKGININTESISKLAVSSFFDREPIDCDGWFCYDFSGTKIVYARGKHIGKEPSIDQGYANWIAFKLSPAPLPDTIDVLKKLNLI